MFSQVLVLSNLEAEIQECTDVKISHARSFKHFNGFTESSLFVAINAISSGVVCGEIYCSMFWILFPTK